MMGKSALLSLSCAVLATLAGPALGASDGQGCEANPVFERLAGEQLHQCERLRYHELQLYRWKVPGNAASEAEPFSVEGEYWAYFNPIGKDTAGRSPGRLEVRRGFEAAVRRAKGELLYADRGKIVYRMRKGGDEFVGEAGCGRGGDDCTAISHKIIRVTPLVQAAGVVGAGSSPDTAPPTSTAALPVVDRASATPAPVPPPLDTSGWTPEGPRRPAAYAHTREPLLRILVSADNSVVRDTGYVPIESVHINVSSMDTSYPPRSAVVEYEQRANVVVRAINTRSKEVINCNMPFKSLADAQAFLSVAAQPYATIECVIFNSNGARVFSRYRVSVDDPKSRTER